MVNLNLEKYPVYKSSGVEWLGDIPEHWEMIKLKYGYKICLGKMLQSQPLSAFDTLEPYLRTANIYWEGVNISNIKSMWFSPYEKILYELKIGDLIISEGGDVGRASIWQGELPKCYIQNAVHRVRSKVGNSNKFLYYWVYFIKLVGYIDLVCNKATIAHFTVEKVKETPVPLPPLSEQQAIANFLDDKLVKIDKCITLIEKEIKLTQEYRTTLISETVTGKIDVRKYHPPQ